MDDPGLSWPAWKFGLKRADLFTSLHDQYNTFTFTLQDPEAFHADVSEISHDAQTTEEFHRMMADRRQQRLLELNESLESLAYEIIGNPKLMDSEHWTFALQLFRTKSFDSLVRYFASYIPSGLNDGKEARSNHSSYSEASTVASTSTTASSVDDATHSDVCCTGPVMTEEPSHLYSAQYTQPGVDAPLSPPESEAATSASVDDDDEAILCCDSTYARSRSMSFSGSESCLLDFSRPILHDDDEDHDHTSQSGSVNTCPTSVSDGEEVRSSIDSVDGKELHYSHVEDEEDDELLTAQFPEDAFDVYDAEQYISEDAPTESDTPTPRQDGVSTNSYIDYKSILSRRLLSPQRQTRRSPSPSSRAHRDVGSSPYEVRRSPDEAHSKIQKPAPDFMRRRVKGRT